MKIGYDAKRIFHNATGLGNYSRDMIRILSATYPEHQYLLYNPKPGKIDRLKPDGSIVQEHRPNSWIWRQLNSLWRQGPILKQADKDNIDIYHGLSGELPRGIDSANFKSVVTIHDLIFVTHPEMYKPADRKIYFNKFKYAADQADVVIAISEQTKADITQYLGTDPSKIKVVYQTCHPLFKSRIDPEEAKQIRYKHALPQEFIITVGTIEPRKNLLSLLKAVKDSNYHVAAIGQPTKYFKEVSEYIAKNGMKDRMHFIHDIQLPDLAALYQQAKMMVYPSLVEGFGIPIIEALYTKTPVICHEKGVFPEAAGPSSVYIDMNNIKQIRYAIDKVWNDRIQQHNMTTDGLAFVQRFNDDVIARDMMNVYLQLVNKK
ncbi:MAG: glycosyltransferase family 4 protein [Bacteroidia bacterium]|nr:glycosyltransferase family 4 protein [Bacteroidia bacterium]